MATEFGPQAPGSVPPEARTPVVGPDVLPPVQDPTPITIFDLESMTREERAKHYIAEQFALGPLGDPIATKVRYRIPEVYRWDSDDKLHYLDGREVDDQNPFNEEVVDPAQRFSSPEEFSYLVTYYRSRLTPEQKKAIRKAEQFGIRQMPIGFPEEATILKETD